VTRFVVCARAISGDATAADKSDEIPPPHSKTSSATASRVGAEGKRLATAGIAMVMATDDEVLLMSSLPSRVAVIARTLSRTDRGSREGTRCSIPQGRSTLLIA